MHVSNLLEEIEDPFFSDHPEWLAESDKAWDVIHRALTDGNLEWDNGTFPLNHVILGGESLYDLDDFIMRLKTPDQVQEIAQAVRLISEERFREDYFRIECDDYDGPPTENEFEYAWLWFQGIRDLYIRAAEADRYVLFTVCQ